MGTAGQWKKQTKLWVIVLLLVITAAVAFKVRSSISSSQNAAAHNWQQMAETLRPYNMVFVDLAKAAHPVAMPGAGTDDAIVVALIRDGGVFLGRNKVDPARLDKCIRDNRTDRTSETMYLRADSRAQYREVENAIEAMRRAGAEQVGLLTKRNEDPQPDNSLWIGNPLLRSVGLELSFPMPQKAPAKVSSPLDAMIIVHVTYRPNATPAYIINSAEVAHADLQPRLNRIFADRVERELFIKGDDNLNFSDIADVIDIARASNVDHIGLVTAEN